MIRRISGHVARVSAAAALLLLTACADWATTPDTTDDGARFNKRGTGTPTLRTATWTGNGSSWDGEQFIITDSRCDESEGEPNLYWVLTAGGNASIDAATITIDGESAPMDRVSKGSLKYTQSFEGAFEVPENVSASYTNAKSANLVLSHGCNGEETGPPPPTCLNPTPVTLEYVTTFTGVSGSVGGVAFTNQTITLTAVGAAANVISRSEPFFNYHKINLATVTLTITGTSISAGATVDGGMQLATSDFVEPGLGGMWWQTPVPPEYSVDMGFNKVTYNLSGIGSAIPVQANRLTTCWSATFPVGGSTALVSSQWNGNVDLEIPTTTVGGGTLVVISNSNTDVSLSGSMVVREYTAP